MLQEKCSCVVYNMIYTRKRGQKPGYIHEMGSHNLKPCQVKCQRNSSSKHLPEKLQIQELSYTNIEESLIINIKLTNY